MGQLMEWVTSGSPVLFGTLAFVLFGTLVAYEFSARRRRGR